MAALHSLYKKNYSDNTVIMVQNWLDSEAQPGYFFLREYLSMKHFQTLKPYHSAINSIVICQDDQFVLKKALTQSLERTKAKLQKYENIESEQISLLFMDII